MRIVSLLPSATEIVCALGAHHGDSSQLLGVSHSCDYPPEICDLPVLTSTRVPVHKSQLDIDQFVRQELAASRGLYALNLERLAALRAEMIRACLSFMGTPWFLKKVDCTLNGLH